MEPFVGIQEAAAFLNLKVSYVYEQVRLNRLPSYKIGNFRRFRISELDAWARARRADGEALQGRNAAAAAKERVAI